MFIVTIGAQKHLFINSKNDDFIRFLPVQFDVDTSEIVAEFIPEAEQKTIRRIIKENPHCNFDYDFSNKKLLLVEFPKFAPGQKNPNHILNKQPKDDAEAATDPKAKTKAKFNLMTDEEKITYLKSITWTPRNFELIAYQEMIGSSGADTQFNADSPECKVKVTPVADFTTKKVKEIKYKKQKNSVTGIEETVMDEMIFEEGV